MATRGQQSLQGQQPVQELPVLLTRRKHSQASVKRGQHQPDLGDLSWEKRELG